MLRNRNQLKGFTIIELMVVVIVIALIAAIGIPYILRARAESKLTGCMENEQVIMEALRLYGVDHDLYALPQGTDLMTVLVDSGCLKKAPICPSAGSNTYKITIPSNPGNEISIICEGDNHSRADAGENQPCYRINSGFTPLIGGND